jgi:hypothetical protein
MNLFSASSLVKSSASQIMFLRGKKNSNVVNDNKIKGDAFANMNNRGIYKEMCSFYEIGKNRIYYSFDEIIDDDGNFVLMEYKSTDPKREIPLWYFQSSIVQVAFYRSLFLINEDNVYKTAKFHVKNGNEENTIRVNKAFSILQFGNEYYDIKVKNYKNILNYYIDKMNCTFDFDSAKEWDSKNKFKDFENLNKFIIFKNTNFNL